MPSSPKLHRSGASASWLIKSIGPEPINDFLSQIPVPLLEGILAMQSAAAKQGNILNASPALRSSSTTMGIDVFRWLLA